MIGSFSLLNACMAICASASGTLQTASVSNHYNGIRKKFTQHAFAKLTLVKLKAPERHTVVAASYPDRQKDLVGEE